MLMVYDGYHDLAVHLCSWLNARLGSLSMGVVHVSTVRRIAALCQEDPVSSSSALSHKRLSFIDEHDGDILFDPVAEAAGLTVERGLFFQVTQFAPALRTGQDIEQFG